MTWEEYGQKKFDEGKLIFAISLIANGTLTIDKAAKRLNISEEELKKMIDSFGESNAVALPVEDRRNE